MPSAASWERNSSLDSWHVAEIECPGVYVEETARRSADRRRFELLLEVGLRC
jgi:hypothetical protein